MKAFRRTAASGHALTSFLGARVSPLVRKEERSGFACYHIRIPSSGTVPTGFHKRAVELIWVLRGGGKVKLGARAVRMARGDSLLIRPPTPHAFHAGRAGMEFIAVLCPWVDSKTDFYALHGGPPPGPKTLRGRLDA